MIYIDWKSVCRKFDSFPIDHLTVGSSLVEQR
nr:MAG TPA: hypothetical protein [Caudoviricetes sp.]